MLRVNLVGRAGPDGRVDGRGWLGPAGLGKAPLQQRLRTSAFDELSSSSLFPLSLETVGKPTFTLLNDINSTFRIANHEYLT